MAKIIGLTGGIASGKSTVTEMFLAENIPVIDTDKIARELLEKGTDEYEQVVALFTSDILLTDQSINRKMLAKIVFANKTKRDQLNQIVHPGVYRAVDTFIDMYEELGKPVIVVDVPLLFETGFEAHCDATVLVYTTREKQLERLMDRDQIDYDYATMKIDAQISLEDKKERADYVIDNSFSILETKKDFLSVLHEIEVN